jgi:phosphomannomutase
MLKFGTDGWSGVISDDFTFENVRKVSQGVAAYLYDHQLADKPLVIGYDARFLADRFADEVVRVMEKSGIDCLLVERDTPLPVVIWSVKDRDAAGAVMVTGAARPANYCGLRFIPDAGEIELKAAPAGGKGGVERFEPRERYLKYIEADLDAAAVKKAELKIVVDPMYGSARGYLDRFLQGLGCQVEEIHGYRDVLFGGTAPDPVEKNLPELKAMKADLGLALSGDASAFGIIDRSGKYYSKRTADGILECVKAVDQVVRRGFESLSEL